MDNNIKPPQELYKQFQETGQLQYKMVDRVFSYSYSFAELCDRLQIVMLKVINSPSQNEALQSEINTILHDIQLHLSQKPMDAEMVKGLVVLGFVNQFIFNNETTVRDADDNGSIDDATLLQTLKKSHRANSLRASAKKHIQNQRGERVDEKLNYGKTEGMWNIVW